MILIARVVLDIYSKYKTLKEMFQTKENINDLD
jgi:hypothetical protein